MPVAKRTIRPYWQSECGRAVVYVGDCRKVMATLEPEQFHAIVTDPPYGLEFMGKEWDAPWKSAGGVVDDPASVGGFQDGSGGNPYSRSRVRIGGVGGGSADARQRRADEVTPAGVGHSTSGGPYLAHSVTYGGVGKRNKGRIEVCNEGMDPSHPEMDGTNRVVYGLSDPQGFQAWFLTCAEAMLRVAKPGAHLLSFGGTRMWHRMACAVEDAGFDIRDTVMYLYGSGFPKSLNISKNPCFCQCSTLPYAHERTEPQTERDLRPLRDSDVSQTKSTDEEQRKVLQSCLPKQGTPTARRKEPSASEVRSGQPSMERGSDVLQDPREIHRRSICTSTGVGQTDGESGWVHHGTPSNNGGDVSSATEQDGSSPPHRPYTEQQCQDEFRTVAGQSEPQVGGTWPNCNRCGKPIIPCGIGTALKPAHEPIILARKLIPGTVVQCVLEHGTGGLNIDGCRVGVDGGCKHIPGTGGFDAGTVNALGGHLNSIRSPNVEGLGRWPANLLLDDEAATTFTNGASRYFYTTKADADDRPHGKGATSHPTVKPLDLMQYLVRLVCAPGGTVLDPFMGSGSTGCAAIAEGMRFVGIEQSKEYADIAVGRIKLALAARGGVQNTPPPPKKLRGVE